jgi:hypothetical protein
MKMRPRNSPNVWAAAASNGFAPSARIVAAQASDCPKDAHAASIIVSSK